MDKEYSKQAIQAFLVLLVTYVVMLLLLTFLQQWGLIKFKPELNGDLLPLIASLPFAALYLLVLVAATAGYARGAIMAKALPLNQVLKTELQGMKMEGAAIKTRIRSGGQVKVDTPLFSALNNMISSRVPILAVLDNDNKVSGVITSHDIMRILQEQVEKNEPTTLHDRLKNMKVQDLQPTTPVVATVDENLQDVIGNMIRNQFTKLIVVKDRQSNIFSGTVDVMDLVGEVFDSKPDK